MSYFLFQMAKTDCKCCYCKGERRHGSHSSRHRRRSPPSEDRSRRGRMPVQRRQQERPLSDTVIKRVSEVWQKVFLDAWNPSLEKPLDSLIKSIKGPLRRALGRIAPHRLRSLGRSLSHAQRTNRPSPPRERPARSSGSTGRSRGADKRTKQEKPAAKQEKPATKQEKPAVSAPVAMETETTSL